jgi:AraC-like DNA-binding protein
MEDRLIQVEWSPSLKKMGLGVVAHKNFSNKDFGLHRVNVVLLSFICRGKCTHMLQDRSYQEEDGAMSVIHYGQRHAILSDDVDVYNIFIDPQNHPLPHLPKELQMILNRILPLHSRFYNDPNEVVRFKVRDIRGLREILDTICHEADGNQQGHMEMMNLYFKILLIKLCREASSQFDGMPRQSSKPMEKVRQEIDRGYQRNWTLSLMSTSLSMHPVSFSRAFKKHTGHSPMEYLELRRIEAASIALRASDDKVAVIAMESGFSDLRRFNLVFKKKMGETPSAYRGRFRI